MEQTSAMTVRKKNASNPRNLLLGAVIGLCVILTVAQFSAMPKNPSIVLRDSLLIPSLEISNSNSNSNTDETTAAIDDAICIFTTSSPDALETRRCQREKCLPLYRNSTSTHRFVLGQPSFETRHVQSHQQGRISAKEEVLLSGQIIDEQEQFHDILAVPSRDFTVDQSIKYLAALNYGVNQNCSFIVLVAQDYCIDPISVFNIIKSHLESQSISKQNKELYFGYHAQNHAGAAFSTKSGGSRHQLVKYMSGGYSGMSFRLAKSIVKDDWTHAVLSSRHDQASNNEDINMGIWVQYAMEKRKLQVSFASPLLKKDDDVVASCSTKDQQDSKISYDHQLCIVTLSASHFFDNRKCQRKLCKTRYTGVPHRFVVGIPSYLGEEDPYKHKNQSYSEKEASIARRIVEENDQYGDILVAPHRDYYLDLPEKRMAVLRFGVDNKCKYTIKVDDEFCVDVKAVQSLIEKHEIEHPNEELYFGSSGFHGNEYGSMTGANGTYVPYYSGWCNGASYKLASRIVDDDWTHTVMRSHYGSSSEDVCMGFWVDHAAKKHNILINREGNAKIIQRIADDVACNQTDAI